jgi:hypothetical protein
MTISVDRRRVLHLLSALGASMVVSRTGFGASDAACATWLSEELDREAIEALGREYLAGRTDVAELDRISSLINAAASDDAALDKVQALMRDDYASDRIVNLSGWFVSTTEAQVLAVLANCRS